MAYLIGIVDGPLHHSQWPQMEAFLQPAARYGGVPVLEPDFEVWAVWQDGELVATATARLTADNMGEIVLCGGREAKGWAQSLADRICQWFSDEGMTVARIYGRKGWARVLDGWKVIGRDKFTWLERAL